MRECCAFYAPNNVYTCQLLEATGKGLTVREQREYFERVFCNSDHYQRCPIFQRFKDCLAKVELRLDYPLVA
jgi:hypothetical protein